MSKIRYRQVHLDFHTSEYIPDIAADFDKEEFAKTLEEAHVDSITCFARCHHGWLYYPSKKFPELIHPGLKNKNFLLEQIEACHKRGIKVPVYTTAQWDGRIMREHPEWLAVDENGEFIDTQGVPAPHFYGTVQKPGGRNTAHCSRSSPPGFPLSRKTVHAGVNRRCFLFCQNTALSYP